MVNFQNQTGVYFKLQKDLDLTDWIAENNPSQGWSPVGIESAPFKGIFLGNNHSISGLMINRTAQDYVGFFGVLDGATISNLTLKGTSVKGKTNVGAFCGKSENATITNVKVEFDEVNGTQTIGGFVGWAVSSTLKQVDLTCEQVSGSSSCVGGFVGSMSSSNVTTSIVNVSVRNTGLYTGGYVGMMGTSTLSAVKVTGNVVGRDETGGIAGVIGGTSSLTNQQYIGDLTGSTSVSGITGSLSESSSVSFISCLSKGKITATGDYVGGVVGVSEGACIAKMENCSHFGDIKGASKVGGLIGAQINVNVTEVPLATWEVRTSRSYSSGTTVKTLKEQVINGQMKNNPVINCTAIGNIQGTDYVGGIIGYEVASSGFTKTKTNTAFNCSDYLPADRSTRYFFHNGEFDFSDCLPTSLKFGNEYARNTLNLAITNSYYSGTITGNNNVGGLAGYKSGGTIERNYTQGAVFGASYVGGIVGQTNGEKSFEAYSTTTIKSNAAINSTVSATKSDIGRIFGKAETAYLVVGDLGSAEGNKSLTRTRVVKSGVVQEVADDNQNGSSVGPSLLKLKATYVAWGWDFDNNWTMLETECFPYKRYQAAPPVIKSDLVSQETTISGQSVDGGTVYMYYKDREPVSTGCTGNNWSFTTEPLQSGAPVQIYTDVEGKTPSYFTTATVGYPGSGTEADPYRVYTAEDLQGASNKGYYKLMNDIDLTQWIATNSPTEGWNPIGRNSGDATYFDGDGHKVTGLWTNTTKDYVGLFSNFSTGEIKNLSVEVAAGKKVKGGNYTGILIGRNANGKITNCSVKGNVEGTGYVGGIAGYVEQTEMSNLSQEGSVTAKDATTYAGGIVGYYRTGTFSNCNAQATVNAEGNSLSVGGLAGYAYCVKTNNCRATATVNAKGVSSDVGGLFGYTYSESITRSMADVNLTATGTSCHAGGVAGYSFTTLSLCLSKGTVTTTCTGNETYTGGLVGYQRGHVIENCYSTANVTGTYYTAGLVGYTFNTINKCYAKGDVQGVNFGAGVVGELDGSMAKLTNSVAVNNVLSLSAQTSWGSRVIGGYKNGCADPDESNYALSTMQVSLNNVPQKKTDDIVEGFAKTQAELMSSSTYMGLGWDFSTIWGIDEGSIYPYLLWEIDVNPVTEINLNKTSLLLAMGKSETLEATVLPMGATNKRLEWTSSNTNVVTVADGVVTAIAEGEAIVTAAATDASGVTATCKVTVTKNKDDAINALRALVADAQGLYDKSSEGSEIGQYAPGSRAALLKVIQDVNAKISDTMSDEVLTQCVSDMKAAIATFNSQKVSAGPDTDITQYDNTIYINKTEASMGATATLVINLKNTIDVAGYQFDLYLPEGLTFVEDEYGDADATMSEIRTSSKRTDLFSFAYQTDGALRILAASTKAYALTGNDGEVVQVKVNVAEGMENGDYPIIIKKIVISGNKDGESARVAYMKSTFTVSSYKLGDVDADGEVSVIDIVTTSRYILGQNPNPFVPAAADANGDNQIDVIDMISKIILNGGAASAANAEARGYYMDAAGNIDMESVKAEAGETIKTDVRLKSNVPVYGFQFDMELPEGVSLQDVSLADNGNNADMNILDFARLANGRYRVLCASTTFSAFTGNGETAIRLAIETENGVTEGDYSMNLSNIVLATEDNGIYPNDFAVPFQIGMPTGICEIGVDGNAEVDVYNASGMLVRSKVKACKCFNGLPKGIYIVNGKKFNK